MMGEENNGNPINSNVNNNSYGGPGGGPGNNQNPLYPIHDNSDLDKRERVSNPMSFTQMCNGTEPNKAPISEKVVEPLDKESLKHLADTLEIKKNILLEERVQQGIRSKNVTMLELGYKKTGPSNQSLLFSQLKATNPDLFSRYPSNFNVDSVIFFAKRQ